MGVMLQVAVLVDRPGLAPELETRGVPVHVVGGKSRVSQYLRLLQYLRGLRPDLLHTTLFESDVLGRLAASSLRIPVVSTLANTPYGREHALESGVGNLQLRGARLADMLTARTVRRFHAVSRATADACVERLHLDKGKVQVIPRGRDQDRLGRRSEQRRASVRERLGVADGASLIVAAGRQDPQKGFDVLVRAIPIVLEALPSAVLCIAGREGRHTEVLHAVVAETGVSNSVRLLGEREDLPDVLSAADVFVLSSHREGLPGVVLEAMALEAPIVASDLPTVRDAVPSGDYALLVPPGDPIALSGAIVTILRTPVIARQMVSASRRRFEEHFDINTVCAAMAEFYRLALSA